MLSQQNNNNITPQQEEDKSSKNSIHYDKLDIINNINETGEYSKDSTTIKRWEDDISYNGEMYVLHYQDEKLPFLGVVDSLFKREGYCINKYENGDEYFGYYSNDKRNKHGFYSYKPKITTNEKIIKNNKTKKNTKITNKEILREYYFGLWKNDKKDGRGVYLWLKGGNEPNEKNFEESNFNAYVGGFEQDQFTKGTILSKEKNNYFVYHGELLNGNKKHGKKCFYYSANLEELLYGTFENNIFVDGYVGKFNDIGELQHFIKYKGKNIIEEVDEKSKNNFELNNEKKIKNQMLMFRNVIMSQDYFGNLFQEFAKVIKFKEENKNDIGILDSEKFLDLMAVIASYNNISIFKDIEKYLEQ